MGWGVSEFEQALRTLKNNNPDVIPFQPSQFGGSHLYSLIIAYGGLPFDYRTTPPTLDFTSPETVEAIRQVLGLAREELMSYNQLINLGGGGFSFGQPGEIPLYSEAAGGFGGVFAGGPNSETPANVDIQVTFPNGSQFNSVNYSLSVAYISSSTTNVEACYNFISGLTQRTDLINAMPANRNLLNDPALNAAQGESAVNFYRELDALMQQPNTIIVPEQGGIGAATLDTFWINRVFDDYVLSPEEIDLELRLEEAQEIYPGFPRVYGGHSQLPAWG